MPMKAKLPPAVSFPEAVKLRRGKGAHHQRSADLPLKAPVVYHMLPCWLRGLAAFGSRKRKHYTRETGGDWAAVRVPAAV
jgi:hypothetical protein